MLRRALQMARGTTARDTGWAFMGEAMGVIGMTVSFTLLGRRLGPEGYGAFVGMYGLLGPAISFNQGAIGLTIYEHIVGRGESGRDVAATSLSSTFLIGGILSVVVIVLGSLWLPTLPLDVIAIFAIGELIVVASLMMAVAVVQATRSFASASRFRILTMALRTAMIVALAVADVLTLRNLAIGQIAVALTTFVLVVRILREETGAVLRPGPFKGSIFRTIFTYSVGIAGTSVQSSADSVTLNATGHVADAGLYGAAMRIIGFAQVPINALSNSTHLSFLDREANHDPVVLSKRYSLVAGAYGLAAAVGLLTFAQLVPVLLGSEFDGTTTMLRWLAPVAFLRSITIFPANGLLGLHRNPLRTGILVANAVWTVGLFLALIPSHSWKGAVIATVISEVTLLVTTWTALLWARGRERAAEARSAEVV